MKLQRPVEVVTERIGEVLHVELVDEAVAVDDGGGAGGRAFDADERLVCAGVHSYNRNAVIANLWDRGR